MSGPCYLNGTGGSGDQHGSALLAREVSESRNVPSQHSYCVIQFPICLRMFFIRQRKPHTVRTVSTYLHIAYTTFLVLLNWVDDSFIVVWMGALKTQLNLGDFFAKVKVSSRNLLLPLFVEEEDCVMRPKRFCAVGILPDLSTVARVTIPHLSVKLADLSNQ